MFIKRELQIKEVPGRYQNQSLERKEGYKNVFRKTIVMTDEERSEKNW